MFRSAAEKHQPSSLLLLRTSHSSEIAEKIVCHNPPPLSGALKIADKVIGRAGGGRCVSWLNPDTSARSNPNRATSAQHLHSFWPALPAASEPATLRYAPATRCDRRRRRAARQSGSHGLAAVPQTVPDRSFLEQIVPHLERKLPSA
jgi:hypothetical protein